jgi:DNA-binding GntR family transcriptional regulator
MSTPLSAERTAFAISRIAAPVREQVEHRLRQAIMAGYFRPGDRLIERELCTLLGVSRTSVREALRQLEGDGLVVNIPNKGMVVATMTREEAGEIYQVRAMLEGLAGRLFAAQASPEQRAALREALSGVEAAHRSGEQQALVSAKDRFYAVLVSGCGNRVVGTVLQSLHDRIASLRFVTLAQPGRAAESVAEMRRMLGAIERRDPEAAWLACVEHVQHAAQVAAQVFEQQEALALPVGPVTRRPEREEEEAGRDEG